MEPLIIIGVGIFDLLLTSTLLFKKGSVERYVNTSPKAYLWRKILGEERALKIIKNILAPIGFLLGVLLTIFGLYLFI